MPSPHSPAPLPRRASLVLAAILAAPAAAGLGGCASEPTPIPGEFRLQTPDAPAAGTDSGSGSGIRAGNAGDQDQPQAGEPAAAIAAIRRGEYVEARAILGRIVFAERLVDARAALDDGRPEDALVATEDALKLAPRDAGAIALDARARLALAEKGIREGLPFTEALLQDALDANLRAGDGPAARIRAARAAYLLGKSDDALRLATEAMARANGAAIEADRLPQRTLAEAAYAVYAARRQAGESADDARDAFERTESALSSLLGRAPNDPWVHRTLANLYEWDGDLIEARDALMRGIDRVAPEAAGELVVQLARVVRSVEDGPAPIDTFVELTERHPDLSEGWWFEAEQRFWDALALLEAKDYRPDEFRRAEEGFRRSRELKPEFDASCKAWETTCRNALGWCLYNAGDLAAAEAAFRSMDELVERGLLVKLEGRLPDGASGLAFCAQAYMDPERGDLLAAARINDFLHGYLPEDVAFANNAGFLLRDAAVAIEYEGRRFCYAAQGLVEEGEVLAALRARAGIEPDVTGTDAVRAAFRDAANARIDQARALMQRSGDAYRAAAELAPDDVRIVNDTALILMYYLHTDIDAAKAMLLRCVELGAEQVRDETLDEDALFNLRSAWGDAHQNLGVLAYVYEHDEAAALDWFERSVEIDADRPDVLEFWLPFLRGEIDGSGFDDYLAIQSWGEPCE